MARALRILLLGSLFIGTFVGAARAAGPAAPAGVSAMALDAGAELAWQPVVGASAYVVYRGGVPVTPPAGVTGTSFTDSGLTNGTSYAYVVHAVSAGVESPDSQAVQVTPVTRGCSSANPIVLENCYPGNSGFLPHAAAQLPTGVEGFATGNEHRAR